MKILTIFKTNYLIKLEGVPEDYFEYDKYNRSECKIIHYSEIDNDQLIYDYVKKTPKEWLDACDGKIILRFKKNKIEYVALPLYCGPRCSLDRPIWEIPIIQFNKNSIRYKFFSIEDLKKDNPKSWD